MRWGEGGELQREKQKTHSLPCVNNYIVEQEERKSTNETRRVYKKNTTSSFEIKPYTQNIYWAH